MCSLLLKSFPSGCSWMAQKISNCRRGSRIIQTLSLEHLHTHTHKSIRLMPVHWMSESVVVWVKKFPLPDTKWKEKGINYRLNITAAMGIHNRSNLLQQQHTRLSFANLECLQVKAGYIGESLTHKLRETYNAASWSMSSFFFSLLLIRARRLFFIITSLERWAVSISNACYGWKCLSWLVSLFDFDRDA